MEPVLTDPSGAAFAAIVSAGVAVEGSIFGLPIHSREGVWTTLRTASDICDSLVFTSDASSDRHVYLEWNATALGMPVDGVTIPALDDHDRFAGIAIHHRPLPAVLALSAEMGRRLAASLFADHFYQDPAARPV